MLVGVGVLVTAAPLVGVRGIAVAIGPLPTSWNGSTPSDRFRQEIDARRRNDRDAARACTPLPRPVSVTRLSIARAASIQGKRRGEPRRTCRLTSRRAGRDECPTKLSQLEAAGRPQTPSIAFSPRRGHAISRRSRLREGRRAEPASASYVVKAAALLRLKLTIDVACSINVRSDAPIIPTGSRKCWRGLRRGLSAKVGRRLSRC